MSSLNCVSRNLTLTPLFMLYTSCGICRDKAVPRCEACDQELSGQYVTVNGNVIIITLIITIMIIVARYQAPRGVFRLRRVRGGDQGALLPRPGDRRLPLLLRLQGDMT